MTKWHHSCTFCRRIDPPVRPVGVDVRQAFDKMLAQATFKHPGHPVPMRSAAALEQEARQRLADFRRILREKQEGIWSKANLTEAEKALWDPPTT